MKKYLFDEILVGSNGEVMFKSFRNISFIECFSTCKCGASKIDICYPAKSKWLFYPKNFKEFLNCLALTKTYDSEYIIDISCANVEYTFDNLLKAFARYVYEEKNATKKELVDFYKKANEIKNTTVEERALLEKDVEELIK